MRRTGTRGWTVGAIMAAASSAAACLLGPAAARAATITVNTTNTAIVVDGNCGLREAVQAVNTQAAFAGCARGDGNNDQIVLAAGTYQTLVSIDALRSMTITGASTATTIIQTGAAYGIGVRASVSGAAVNPVVKLSNLSLQQLTTQTLPVIGIFIDGAAQNFAEADLDHVTISGFNSAGVLMTAPSSLPNMSDDIVASILRTANSTIANNPGAGISGAGSARAFLTTTTVSGNRSSGLFLIDGAGAELAWSTIQGNSSAGDGGGIHISSATSDCLVRTGRLFLKNTTVANNSSGGNGGGIFWEGDFGLAAHQSTISGNRAVNGGGVYVHSSCQAYNAWDFMTVVLNDATSQGGGVFKALGGSGGLPLFTTIVAKNTIGGSPLPSASGADVFAIDSEFVSAVIGTREGWSCGNLPQDDCAPASVLPSPGTVLDPRLGALGNYGGPTQTHPLLTGSPAIDLAPLPNDDDHGDQRGLLRIVGGNFIDGNGSPPAGPDVGAFELQCPRQLVTNEMFEMGANDWVASFGATIASSNDTANSGQRSLKVTNRNIATWQGAIYSLLNLATPGAALTASGWVRIAGDPSEPVLLTRRAVCSGGAPTYQTVASGTATDTDWVFLSGTANIPNCTLTELTVYFEGPRTGVVMYIDDVSVRPQTTTCETIAAALPLAGSLPVTTDWGTGYCVELRISNPNSVPTTTWSASLNLNGTSIYNIWNLAQVGTTGQVTLTPTADWSRVIPAEGMSHSLGFCANRPSASGVLPFGLTVTGTF